MITVGSSILVFFNILKLLPVLFFLEFEILLSIVHPILFVDFLEHAAIRVLVSCDVKVYLSFLFSLRHWWNNIFETLFVLLIDWHVWIYLQLFGSLEIVFTGATLLTQIVLLLATCGSNDGSMFFCQVSKLHHYLLQQSQQMSAMFHLYAPLEQKLYPRTLLHPACCREHNLPY